MRHNLWPSNYKVRSFEWLEGGMSGNSIKIN